MKNTMKLLALILVLLLGVGSAAAESLSLEGKVVPARTVPVYAAIGGTVAEVAAQVGQEVGADDVLYSLKTTKVYAQESGTVTGVFGEPGDDAAQVAQRYGAVMYLEGASVYSVSASTDNAYNTTANKFIRVGEKVSLQCRSSQERKGEGTVTAVEGTGYTVKVTAGTFIPGDSVDVFRDAAHTNSQRIGRGTVSRVNPSAVTASGSIVRFAVADGEKVERGQLLLETLDGSFDGLYMSGVDQTADQAGVVGSLSASQGSPVSKGSVVAVIYPLDAMRVEASVPEDSRGQIKAGDKVTIELESDEAAVYTGEVVLVSAVAEAGAAEVSYRVLVDFTPDEAVRFGMSVVVTTPEEEAVTDGE